MSGSLFKFHKVLTVPMYAMNITIIYVCPRLHSFNLTLLFQLFHNIGSSKYIVHVLIVQYVNTTVAVFYTENTKKQCLNITLDHSFRPKNLPNTSSLTCVQCLTSNCEEKFFFWKFTVTDMVTSRSDVK